MSAVSSYSELLAKVITLYGNRTDMTALVPGFVQACEAKVNRYLRANDQTAIVTLTAASGVLSSPADYHAMISLRNGVANKPKILQRPMSFIEQYLNSVTETGDPCFAAEAAGTIYLAPTPLDGDTFRLVYDQKVPSLSDTAPTNWLLADHPDIYTYGVLEQMAIYDHDDGAKANYSAEFVKGLAAIQGASNMDEFGEDLVIEPSGAIA